jgi:hypothetical protein
MLKKILLNGKKIPVPVPIKTLPQAMAWVQKHLVRPDHVITRLQLDGREIEVQADGIGPLPELALDEQSDLRLKIDSPMEICIQTIDALRNLSSVIGRNLKPVAVQLWEHKGHRIPVEARTVLDDVSLLVELFEHILVLVDKRIDLSNAMSLERQIKKSHAAIGLALQQADWKGLARVLLNQLESPIMEMSAELSSLEKLVMEIEVDRKLERKLAAAGNKGSL